MAQKLRRTTWPRRSERRAGLPIESKRKVLFWLAAKAGFTLAVVCAGKHVEKARDEYQDQSGI